MQWISHDLLTHRVRTTPRRPTVSNARGTRELAGTALDTQVDAWAAALPETVDSGDRVAVLSSTRFELVLLYWAIRRRGATMAPLNVGLAQSELRERLERLQPTCLVCEHDTAPAATDTADVPVYSIDATADADTHSMDPVGSPSVTRASATADDDALILFTSGTTGRPKAVRLTVGNLVWSALGSALRLGVSPSDRWLACLPMYHTGGILPIVRSAVYGTALVVQNSFDAEDTPAALRKHSCTGVSLVPTMLTRILDADVALPSTVETILLGGAPASEALLNRAREADLPVHPTYGMTETASQIATARPADIAEDPETVGYPLWTINVSIVDETGDPVSTGAVGEITVSGPTVTPGYLDTPAERVGEGLKTGDLGLWTSAGRLRIVGRVDDLITTGGETVAPAAVEEVIEAHPRVKEAVVVGIPDEEWGERVGALVVPDTESVDFSDLSTHCRDQLAGFKIPRVWQEATTLPRTNSGTIDRPAVRARLDAHGQG